MDIEELHDPGRLFIGKTITFHYTADRSNYDDMSLDDIKRLETSFDRLKEDINDLTEKEVTIITTVTELNG